MKSFNYPAKQFCRAPDDQILAGVCSGAARHFALSITWLRIGAFLLLIFLPLFVVIGYVFLVWKMPIGTIPTVVMSPEEEDRTNSIHHTPRKTLATLRARIARIDRRIRHMETLVTDKDYTLRQKFHDL